jgi:hypothetical protein
MNELSCIPYYQVPGLEHVYLEDSYVTGINELPGCLEFSLEVVLREGHPLYEPPDPGEQYSYRTGRLVFSGVQRVHWIERHLTPFEDATGQIDYGNIDALCETDGVYRIEGDWGRVEVVSSPPKLLWDDGEPANGS